MKLPFQLAAGLLIGLLPSFGSADEVTIPIISFDDDAEEDVSGPTVGDIRRSSADLEFGNENGILQLVGLRFQGLGITTGSLIHSASINFTANEADGGSLVIPVFGELSPDAVAFGDASPTSTATPISGRNLTAATALWDMGLWDPMDPTANTAATPDLAAIVQEIVNQSSWSSGNSMAFIFQNDPDLTETSERIAVSFDDPLDPNHLSVPVLSINFTPTLPGDANLDGFVDGLDVDALAQGFGNGSKWGQGDFNSDGIIDGLDVDILAQNFGSGPSSISSVPEPGILSLLSIAGMIVSTRRSRSSHLRRRRSENILTT